MGCGSSSLKGAQAPKGLSSANTNNDDFDERPMRKVATNFTAVDYEGERSQRQGSGEGGDVEPRNGSYAPDETAERTGSVNSEAIRYARNGVIPKEKKKKTTTTATDEDANTSFDNGNGRGNDNDKGDGEPLKPYQSIAGNAPEEAEAGTQTLAKTSTRTDLDPTSKQAKDAFASTNDPINEQSSNAILSSATNGDSNGNINSNKWQNPNIKEDDLIKYTGKTKGDVLDLVDRGDGVGGGQPADISGVGAIG